MKKIKKPPTSWATYDHTKMTKEKNSGEVKTVPNEAYTIRELYERHAVPEGLNRNGHYDEDVSHDDDVSFRTPGFDLSEIDNKLNTIEAVKKRIENKKILDQKSKDKEKIKSELLKEIEQIKAKEDEGRHQKKSEEKKEPDLEDKRVKS